MLRPAPAVLVASLGGKPQVVTFALDALLASGAAIQRVCAVHLSTADPRIQRSLDKLDGELRAAYGKPAPRLDSVPIHAPPPLTAQGTYAATKGRPIDSADDPAAPEAIWMTLHRLISTLRAEGYAIEMCVTGGPRLIALQALSAATVLLGPQDHCWHVYTPLPLREAAGEGRIMHETQAAAPVPRRLAGGKFSPSTSEERIRLIQVPLLPLGLFIPGLQQAAYQSPEQIMSAGRRWLSAQDEQRCRDVANALTPRQRDVLGAFARGARGASEAARQLHVAPSTVNTHKTVILQECRNAWELPPEETLDFHFLREHFGDLPDAFWEG